MKSKANIYYSLVVLCVVASGNAHADLWGRIKGAAEVLFSSESEQKDENFQLNECKRISKEVNNALPQKVDNITTMRTFVCLPEGDSVTAVYEAQVELPEGHMVGQKEINKLRQNLINTFCTSPDKRAAINTFNIKYSYSDQRGIFLGDIRLNINDCP